METAPLAPEYVAALQNLPGWERKDAPESQVAEFCEWLETAHPHVRLTVWQMEVVSLFYRYQAGVGKTFLLNLLNEFEAYQRAEARKEL